MLIACLSEIPLGDVSNESVIGYGDTMRISCQVIQYMVRSTKRLLEINHPLVFMHVFPNPLDVLSVSDLSNARQSRKNLQR